MRIAVVHTTLYRYSSPVFLEPHTIRLRPREDASQRLGSWTLGITPAPVGRTECLDQDGNTVVRAWFHGLTAELGLHTEFTLENVRGNPFDYLLTGSDVKLPMEYALPLRAALEPVPAPEFLYGGARLCPLAGRRMRVADDGVPQRAQPAAVRPHPPGRPRSGRSVRRGDSPCANRKGSCRDLAVLFCAACRAVGLAARFVSGYERDASLQENGDLHAWAEVYLEGGGWRGYDPSRALAVASTHVAVAAASDPLLASPVSGTFRGAATAKLEFSISMQVD